MRHTRWIWMAFSASLFAMNVGCSANAQLAAKVETPKPPPPPPDADGDGIIDDGTDKCVGEKEDGLAPDPKDGCVSTDPDQDGIIGAADKCPTEPETMNKFEDEDGCPDTPRVMVVNNEVKIKDKILFAFGKADIDPASDDLIKNIAKVINENPTVEFMEVAGHADKVGNDQGNVLLTKRRAEAVVKALAKEGVDKNKMRGVGYGRYCPLNEGDTEEAREQNRRVEFKIMRIAGKETGVALGCDEAVKRGIKPGPVPATAPTAPAAAPAADAPKAG